MATSTVTEQATSLTQQQQQQQPNNTRPNSVNEGHETTTPTMSGPQPAKQQQPQVLSNGQTHDITQLTLSTPAKASRLTDFYRGKNILITGVTGFIGKICLVRMICGLGEVGTVYVLLRPKKGMTPQQRFNKMLNEEPFCSLSKGQLPKGANDAAVVNKHFKVIEPKKTPLPDWSKVVAVEGDMSCDNLGLSADDRERITKSVNVIFNIAASVQFDAPLKQNLRDNYIGCRNMLQLASQCENLVSLIHVSTFFSNSHISHVEEKVLPMSRDCEKMAELISWMPDSLCDTVAPQIMESRPNTYIYTKAMAENLVQKYQGRMPIAIVRPSIVTPSLREPMPGWVDNVNGPMGLGVLASLGILRNIDWNYWGVADVIPVDYVVNTCLVAAERTARAFPKEIKVYNCSSSSLKPNTWGAIFEVLREESLKAPPYKMLRMPIKVPKHKRANKLGFALTKWSELLFAYFIDFILMICGQKQLLTKLVSRLHHGYEILKPFTTTEYTCSNDNLVALYEEMHDDDRDEFDYPIYEIEWDDAIRYCYYGARSRILKEDISNLPQALFKMKILSAVETVFTALFYVLIAWTSYRLLGAVGHQISLSF